PLCHTVGIPGAAAGPGRRYRDRDGRPARPAASRKSMVTCACAVLSTPRVAATWCRRRLATFLVDETGLGIVCPAPAGSRRTLRAAAAVIEKLGDRSQACHASGAFLEASYVSAPRRTREPAMSDNVYHSLILAACALLLQPASPAGAACNLIPGTSLTFNSALGAT